MFTIYNKSDKKGWSSESKKELEKESGINYHTLDYYSRKTFYETDEIIFIKTKTIKSKQGGFRIKSNKNG